MSRIDGLAKTANLALIWLELRQLKNGRRSHSRFGTIANSPPAAAVRLNGLSKRDCENLIRLPGGIHGFNSRFHKPEQIGQESILMSQDDSMRSVRIDD